MKYPFREGDYVRASKEALGIYTDRSPAVCSASAKAFIRGHIGRITFASVGREVFTVQCPPDSSSTHPWNGCFLEAARRRNKDR